MGRLTREPRRGFEAVGFSYAGAWLEHPDRYALQLGLVLAPGTYAPPAGAAWLGQRLCRPMAALAGGAR